jgi:hypothetical protein
MSISIPAWKTELAQLTPSMPISAYMLYCVVELPPEGMLSLGTTNEAETALTDPCVLCQLRLL